MRFHEDRVVENIINGRARFGKVQFTITPQDVMQKKAAYLISLPTNENLPQSQPKTSHTVSGDENFNKEVPTSLDPNERALRLVIEEYVKNANTKRTSDRVQEALKRHQNELRLEKMEFFLHANRRVLNKIELTQLV